ncbi:MAG: translocation/assembly module TamB [Gammaproteobacteria bacterium]|nr:translocation/assembly module TamB [Gammaproteobacteria bacterium]
MLLSLLRITFTTLVALLVISLCLAAWFLVTDEGNRELANLAQYRDSRLSIELEDGSLLRGLNARSFGWQDEKLGIQAEGIASDWDARCLLKKTFCANELSIERLAVKTRSSGQEKPQRSDAIRLPEIRLPISLDVKQLAVKQLLIDYADQAQPLLFENINLRASSDGERVSIQRLSARFRHIIASVSGQIDLREQYPLSLKLGAILEKQIAGEDLSLLANLEGSLASLMVEAESVGAIEAKLSGAANVLAPDIPTHARLTWQEAGWPLKEQTLVKVSDGSLDLQGDLTDFSSKLTARVSGKNIPDSHVSLAGLLNTQRFKAEAVDIDTLEGKILGEAELDWSDRLAWSSNLHFSGINPQSLAAGFPGDLAGNLLVTGRLNDDRSWELQVLPAVIQGQLRGQPLHAHAIVQHSAEQRWQIESLRLISEQNHLEISGEIADQWNLAGQVDLQQLHLLMPDVAGSIAGEFSVLGALQTPDVNFQLQAPALHWQKYSLDNLTLGGKVREYAETDSLLRLSLDRLTIDQQVFNNLELKADGSRAAHRFSIGADGPEASSLRADVEGRLSKALDWQGTLLGATVAIPQHTLRLADKTGLSWQQNDKTFSVDPHCWQSDRQGRLCLLEPLLAAADGRAVLRLDDYALQQLDGFLPENTRLSGNATVDATLGWGPALPGGFSLELEADIGDGKLQVDASGAGEALDFSWQILSLSARMDDRSILASADIESQALGKARARLSIDPTIKPLTIQNGEINLDGFDLGFLQTFFPDYQEIGGRLSANGRLTGPLREPVFNGRVLLEDPVIKSAGLPLSVTGGKIEATIFNNTAQIDGRIDSGNGEVRLGGNADWQDLKAWRLALTVDGEALVISQKPLVESVVAPALTIAIKPRQVDIGGRLDIMAAAINIKEIPKGATTLSPDIVVDKKTTDKTEDGKWQINTDVTVVLGKAVRLSGYGLRAQLTGDFKLVQQDDKPLQLFGEITIPEGIYKSYGQDLTIREGQILLIGPVEQSTFDIRAYREVDDVRAGLHITGNIDDPVLTLYSEPFMADERILAYIVLGRDIDAGENNDSNILATAAISMGISNGRGLATDIAEAFGIREFNIEASGRGEDTQVLLSGRLSSRLLVRYGVGVFTPVNTLYLRYDLTRKLYLETAQGLERAVDLIYSFEF